MSWKSSRLSCVYGWTHSIVDGPITAGQWAARLELRCGEPEWPSVRMPRRDTAPGDILTSTPIGCLLATETLIHVKETWTKEYKLFSLKTSWWSYSVSLPRHESLAVKARLKVILLSYSLLRQVFNKSSNDWYWVPVTVGGPYSKNYRLETWRPHASY